MPAFDFSPASLTAIIVTLSFAAGLNVYATVFALGVMSRLHWISLPDGLLLVEHTSVIIISGVLFAIEMFADKIPAFDLVWNALHTFIRIPAAALMAYAAGNHLSPEMRVLVTALGAGIATVAHTSKTAARVAVTPSPEPVSNIALSSAEDVSTLGLTYAATHHPLAAGISVAAICAACLVFLWLSYSLIRKGIQRLTARFRKTGPTPTATTLQTRP